MLFKYFIFTVFISIFAYLAVNKIDTETIIDNFVQYYRLIRNSIMSDKGKTVDKVGEDKLFSQEELSKYTGKDEKKIYLALLGNVFDVTKGRRFYDESGTYHGFAGRDATRAFITGDFRPEGLTDDVNDLDLQDLLSLETWLEHYKKDYIYKGKLIGRFYTLEGNPTEHLRKFRRDLLKAKQDKEAAEDLKTKFPPCNVEWSQEKGSVVWCSDKSGGISRDWVGVPRKYYEPGKSDFRCACINTELLKSSLGNIQEYESCSSKATRCQVYQ